MANISLKEFSDAFDKSGLGGSELMNGNDPFAKNMVTDLVKSRDTRGPQLRSNYQSAMSKIAEMDQKLGQMYGDPTSKLYIEHAGQRDNAKAGAADVGYRQVNDIGQQIQANDRSVQNQIDEGLKLYQELNQALNKSTTKISKGGGTSAKSGKTSKKSGVGGDKDLNEWYTKLGLKLTDFAHIYDPVAREIFLTAPVDFQNYIMRDIYTHPDLVHPDQGYSPEELRDWLNGWQTTFKGK